MEACLVQSLNFLIPLLWLLIFVFCSWETSSAWSSKLTYWIFCFFYNSLIVSLAKKEEAVPFKYPVFVLWIHFLSDGISYNCLGFFICSLHCFSSSVLFSPSINTFSLRVLFKRIIPDIWCRGLSVHTERRFRSWSKASAWVELWLVDFTRDWVGGQLRFQYL